MKNYDKILYECATKNIVTRPALWMLTSSEAGMRQMIQKAIDNNHVRLIKKVYKTAENGERRQETVVLFVLTPDGYDYILQKLVRYVPWMTALNENRFNRFSIYGTNIGGQRNMMRFLASTMVGIMMDAVGADEFIMALDGKHYHRRDNNSVDKGGTDGPEGSNRMDEEPTPTIAALVYNAWNKTDYMREGELDADDRIIYIDSRTFKRGIEGLSQDLSQMQFIGYVESQKRDALVFSNTDLYPIQFHRRSTIKEVVYYKYTMRRAAVFKHSEHPMDFIYIAPSVSSFQRVYYSRYITAENSLKKILNRPTLNGLVPKKNVSFFGDSDTSHAWILPQTRDGVVELRELMTVDLERERKSILRQIEEENEYMIPNNQIYITDFPFVDEYNNHFAIGIHMDAKQMFRLDHIAGQEEFAVYILCQSWQIPYYEAVLKHAKAYLIDDIIEHPDHAKNIGHIPFAADTNARYCSENGLQYYY